ncbi:MAG: hypothetical protein R3E53_14405 [Myxococcota bacterium]
MSECPRPHGHRHPSGCTIGERFFIDHGTGVVIGETAVIGHRVPASTRASPSAPPPARQLRAARQKRHPTIGRRHDLLGGDDPGRRR